MSRPAVPQADAGAPPREAARANAPLLEVENLEVLLRTPSGPVQAIDRISFSLAAGETLAIVGESGCGKSLTALSLLGLLPQPQLRLAGGVVRLRSRDLAPLAERELQRVRGREIAMIFQDPMNSLNPVRSIGAQLVEMLQAHERIGGAAAWQRARQLLEQVSIPNAQARLHDYPHRLSGGMCQRVMIAMAIASRPKVLIADEPTTALDVTIQAQILSLLARIQRESGMGLILITHDLGVVAEIADRVLVMYAGRKVEEAPVDLLFEAPQHPYTQGLLAATPSPLRARGSRLADIPGMVADLSALPPGCAFEARCPRAFERCRSERPGLFRVGAAQQVACFAAAAGVDPEGGRHELAVGS